jgi:hypothetical protein
MKRPGRPVGTQLSALSEGNVAKNHRLGTGIGNEIPYFLNLPQSA